ncbi:hypothetical protein [Tunturiibacter gelidiferens]|uniref:hypothetical protein n=1 Tax=Tunturiibacter gelidiferens TaxID=3069689 RepID=UPI003D9BF737
MIQAVSMVSSLKYGCSPATHSPRGEAFGFQFYQENTAASGDAEAGLEGMS